MTDNTLIGSHDYSQKMQIETGCNVIQNRVPTMQNTNNTQINPSLTLNTSDPFKYSLHVIS